MASLKIGLVSSRLVDVFFLLIFLPSCRRYTLTNGSEDEKGRHRGYRWYGITSGTSTHRCVHTHAHMHDGAHTQKYEREREGEERRREGGKERRREGEKERRRE